MNEFVYANSAGIGFGFGFRPKDCNISILGGILGVAPETRPADLVARKDP
jgi:hypothetical protein